MDILEVLKGFEDQLDVDSGRTKRPRTSGITMVLVFDAVNHGPTFIEPFQELVDRIKLLDTLWHHDPSVIKRVVAAYRAMDMAVAMGGTQFEIAKAQDKVDEYIQMLKDLGVNEVEVENHASGLTLKDMQEEVRRFKEEGFQVVGEVGKKWWWKDPTRISRDLISVERTCDQALGLLDAGADYLYWEGMIVRSLIGTQLENEEGQQQLRDVVKTVGQDKLIFELWDDRGLPNHPLIAWMVKEFGPNVNLANIMPWDVKFTEWVRHGIVYEMDHPYMRWHQDRSVSANWWSIESPDYSVDMERTYTLKDFH